LEGWVVGVNFGSSIAGIGGFGEGEYFDVGIGGGLAEGLNDGAGGGAGGEDVVDEEDGLVIGEGVGGGVDVLELDLALFAGEAFVAEGGSGLL